MLDVADRQALQDCCGHQSLGLRPGSVQGHVRPPPEAPSWISELAHYCTRRTAGSWAYGGGLPGSRHLGHHDTGACAGRVERTRRHSQAQRGTDEGGEK